MNRSISGITVAVSHGSTYVTVYFDNKTVGYRTFDGYSRKWITAKMSDEELATAKALAVVDGKWQNWKPARYPVEDVREDIADGREPRRQHYTDVEL